MRAEEAVHDGELRRERGDDGDGFRGLCAHHVAVVFDSASARDGFVLGGSGGERKWCSVVLDKCGGRPTSTARICGVPGENELPAAPPRMARARGKALVLMWENVLTQSILMFWKCYLRSPYVLKTLEIFV